jgi:hypothetical protein
VPEGKLTLAKPSLAIASPPVDGTRVFKMGAAAAGTFVGTALVAVAVAVLVGVIVGVAVGVRVSVGPGVLVGAGVEVGPVVGDTVGVVEATTPTSLTSTAGFVTSV